MFALVRSLVATALLSVVLPIAFVTALLLALVFLLSPGSGRYSGPRLFLAQALLALGICAAWFAEPQPEDKEYSLSSVLDVILGD